MIGIAQVRDAIKSKNLGFNGYYVGKINEKLENEIGFYHLDASTNKYHKFIGEQCYRLFPVQILIHGFKDVVDGPNQTSGLIKTEELALKVYETLDTMYNFQYTNFQIIQVKLLDNYPVCIWTNEYGIYEFSIECILYVQETNENSEDK